MPQAFLMSRAAGGVLVMKEKLRSEYTVMTTGIIMPMCALGALVEVLGELADVDAVLAKRGADRGSRRCLAGGNLESDVSNYFLCHLKAPLSCKILILDCFDLIKLEVDRRLSAEHGNNDAHTVLVGLKLVHRADEALKRAVGDLDGVAELIALTTTSWCSASDHITIYSNTRAGGLQYNLDRLCSFQFYAVSLLLQSLPGFLFLTGPAGDPFLYIPLCIGNAVSG